MQELIPFTVIATSRLTLRPFRPADLAVFLAYRNDPEVARFQGWSTPMSEEAARDFLEENAQPCWPLAGGIQIAVALTATDELLGDLYVAEYGGDPRQAIIGYSLARQHQGRGYGTEAVSGLLEQLLRVNGLHRVVATVDARNGPSIALLERLGMRREGHFRQAFYDEAAGGWYDEYLYALLSAEWLQRGGGATHAKV
jgi:RimJ/RimL family protein N-acetyltransferase